MKIVSSTFADEIEACPAAILWNYWDYEHLTTVHPNYTEANVLFESKDAIVNYVTFKMPVFNFLKSTALDVMFLTSPHSMKIFNYGIFNILSITEISVEELRKDYCRVSTTHKFVLRGWHKMLAPYIRMMIHKWHKQVWEEDIPLKLRRHKMLRHGFRDFSGLPNNINDRASSEEIPFTVPLPRLRSSSVNKLLDI